MNRLCCWLNQGYVAVPDDEEQHFHEAEEIEARLSKEKYRIQCRIIWFFVSSILLTLFFLFYHFYCAAQIKFQSELKLTDACSHRVQFHSINGYVYYHSCTLSAYRGSTYFLLNTIDHIVEFSRDPVASIPSSTPNPVLREKFQTFLCEMNSEVNCKILNLGDGAKRESIAASFDSNSLYYSTESNLKKGINGSHDQGKTIFSAQLPNEEFIYVYSKNDYKILPSYTGSTIFQISSQHYAFPNYAYAPQLNSTVHYSNDNGHTFKLILVSPTEFLGGAISDDGDVLLLLTNGEGIWRVETSQEVNDHEITVITKFTDAPSTYWVGIACNSRCSKAVAIAGEPDVCRSSAGSGIYLTMDGRSFSFVQLAKHLHSVVATADFAFMAASSYSTLYYSVDYGYSWRNVEFSGYSGLGIVENSLITLRPPNRSNLIMDDVLEIPIPPPILETYNCANFGSWNQVNYIILALIGEIVLFYIVYQYYYHIGYEMGHLLFYYQKRPTVGFISHNWFDGERNRTPHIRARQLKDALERINLSMWFDEKSMHYRIFRSIDHGIRHSKVVIVCITRQYIKKVNSRDANDACFYELNRTSTSKIIPLLMEPGLEGSTLITRGFIGEKIEGLQYLDFSCNFNSEPLRFEEAIQELQTCIGERIAGLQPIEN